MFGKYKYNNQNKKLPLHSLLGAFLKSHCRAEFRTVDQSHCSCSHVNVTDHEYIVRIFINILFKIFAA